MTVFSAGQALTATALNRIQPFGVIKPLDESLTSTTTMQNDDHLVVAGLANTNYVVEFRGFYIEAAGTTVDLKCCFTQPVGCILDLDVMGPHQNWNGTAANLEVEFSSWQNQTATTTSTKIFGTVNAVNFPLRFSGTWRVGNTAGNLQWQWAPQNNVAIALTVQSGSSLILTPLLT